MSVSRDPNLEDRSDGQSGSEDESDSLCVVSAVSSSVSERDDTESRRQRLGIREPVDIALVRDRIKKSIHRSGERQIRRQLRRNQVKQKTRENRKALDGN